MMHSAFGGDFDTQIFFMTTTIVQFMSTAAGAFAGFSLGYAICYKRVLFWRLKWIDMEHTLAPFQGREPRKISEIKEE